MRIIMRTELSSLEIYNKLPREFSFGRKKLTVKYIEDLLEAMKAELVIGGYSPLLDASINECIYFCSSRRIATIKFGARNYYITEMRRRSALPMFDAWQFPFLLSDYMNGRFSADSIEKLLPYYWGDYAPNDPDPRRLLQALQSIDALIVELRKKMYTGGPVNSADRKCAIPEDLVITELAKQKADDKVKALMAEAEEEKKTMIAQARVQAESEAREIVESARKQGESEKQSILDAAQKQADKLIHNASVTADRKIDDAKKRILDLSANKRLDEYAAEQGNTEQRFSAVREALVKANESIKLLEDSFSEDITRKAYTQLIELYNLIADTKESTFALAVQTNSQDLENAAYNMDVFLDMLVEYLADYGVRTIASSQGDAFSAKHHTLGKTGVQFDPRNARISRSLRNGFIWGEQVLQKERVEIEGDKYVSWY